MKDTIDSAGMLPDGRVDEVFNMENLRVSPPEENMPEAGLRMAYARRRAAGEQGSSAVGEGRCESGAAENLTAHTSVPRSSLTALLP